jgi:hypothetical protein
MSAEGILANPVIFEEARALQTLQDRLGLEKKKRKENDGHEHARHLVGVQEASGCGGEGGEGSGGGGETHGASKDKLTGWDERGRGGGEGGAMSHRQLMYCAALEYLVCACVWGKRFRGLCRAGFGFVICARWRVV